MEELAPIALFCYNRPSHTIQVLEALSKNELANESVLYIFSDGPKKGTNLENLNEISEVRTIINSKKWTKEVHIIEQKENKGLANSIIDGISQVINKHGKIIVLEDDIVPQTGFLKYMNDALIIYKDEESVMNISGYMYPYQSKSSLPSTFFLRVAAGWGWATWARAWKYYNHNIDEHIQMLTMKNEIHSFNIDGSINLYDQLLANKNNKLYTWGIRWYATWFTKGGFNLFPSKSLVKNIGFDGSGIHCDDNNIFISNTTDFIVVEKQLVEENIIVRTLVRDFFLANNSPSSKPILTKLSQWIKTFQLRNIFAKH